ncbi:hypothetical protein BU17DRAFT_100096 [Hysterangium stoloniferum]|nr:hypothetical protein BU17DRAFT_100096 [Hysterangium stoloniferum]
MTSDSTHESPTAPTDNIQGQFGFAKLDNDIFLVQLISSPAPSTYQAHVFRHNFISIFSFSHTVTLGSNLIEVLQHGDESTPKCWLEEETETVFVAPDVMARYIWLKDRMLPRTNMRPMAMRHRALQPVKVHGGLHHKLRSRLAS